jgi:hypothetical protein
MKLRESRIRGSIFELIELLPTVEELKAAVRKERRLRERKRRRQREHKPALEGQR